MVSTTLSLALAGIAAASPLAIRDYPPTSMAQAFHIVANVTDPSKDLNPPINGFFITGVHIGAGLAAAVLAKTEPAYFFVNGTNVDVSAAYTSIALPPIGYTGGGPVPQGFQFGTTDDENIMSIGLNNGPGTHGAGVYPGLRSSYADVFAPWSGSFMVCHIDKPMYGRPQYQVRYSKTYAKGPNGPFDYDIPADCVAIRLLAQCADLPPLQGVDELDIIVEGVKCYNDVASINWKDY
jgi:hypothetical protein